MSDKTERPEKIYLCEKFFGTLSAVSLEKQDGRVEYIRADLAKPSEWISVEDQLPEMGNYIVCLKNNAVMECSFSDITGSPYWFKIGVCAIDKENPVTHWQPLPPPPPRETP